MVGSNHGVGTGFCSGQCAAGCLKTESERLEWVSAELSKMAGLVGTLADGVDSGGRTESRIRAAALLEFLQVVEERLVAVGLVVDNMALSHVLVPEPEPVPVPERVGFERELLGSMLVGDGLVADFFQGEGHGSIFNAVFAVKAEGCQVNVVSVADRLKLEGKLEAVGGLSYLATIAAGKGAGSVGGKMPVGLVQDVQKVRAALSILQRDPLNIAAFAEFEHTLVTIRGQLMKHFRSDRWAVSFLIAALVWGHEPVKNITP